MSTCEKEVVRNLKTEKWLERGDLQRQNRKGKKDVSSPVGAQTLLRNRYN